MSKKSDQVQLAALELRLIDMARGTMGHRDFDYGGEDGGLCNTMGPAEWLTWVAAVKKTFLGSAPACAVPVLSVAFALWNLHHFAETTEEAALHLFGFGARP